MYQYPYAHLQNQMQLQRYLNYAHANCSNANYLEQSLYNEYLKQAWNPLNYQSNSNNYIYPQERNTYPMYTKELWQNFSRPSQSNMPQYQNSTLKNDIFNDYEKSPEISSNEGLKTDIDLNCNEGLEKNASKKEKTREIKQIRLKNKSKKHKKKKKITRITKCSHKEKKHYAKNMCSTCYHSKGREKVAWLCPHVNEPHYAKGLCQKCYQIKYVIIKKEKEELKQKEKEKEKNGL